MFEGDAALLDDCEGLSVGEVYDQPPQDDQSPPPTEPVAQQPQLTSQSPVSGQAASQTQPQPAPQTPEIPQSTPDEIQGQIGDALKTFKDHPDFQTGKPIQRNDLDNDYAKSLHEELSSLVKRGGDGIGQVHDLSKELGHGAIGYHSPHGVMTLQPPRFGNDGWELQYMANQQQEAPAVAEEPQANPVEEPVDEYDDEYGLEGHEDYPEQPEAPPPGKRIRGTANKERGLPMSHNLESTMDDLGLHTREDREGFMDILHSQWHPEVAPHQEFNDDYDMAIPPDQRKKLATMIGNMKKGGRDHDTISKWDEFVDTMERDYPHLLKRFADPEKTVAKADMNEAAVNLVLHGKYDIPKAYDDKYVSKALAILQKHKQHQESQNDTEAIDMDQWSRREDFKYRVQRWSRRNEIRHAYAKRLGLFDT